MLSPWYRCIFSHVKCIDTSRKSLEVGARELVGTCVRARKSGELKNSPRAQVKALKEPERDRKKVKHVKHSGNVSLDEIIDIARQMKDKSMSKTLAGGVKVRVCKPHPELDRRFLVYVHQIRQLMPLWHGAQRHGDGAAAAPRDS